MTFPLDDPKIDEELLNEEPDDFDEVDYENDFDDDSDDEED